MKIEERLRVTPLIPEDDNWRVTCASICEAPDGSLLCAWYGGPTKPESGTVDPSGLVYLSRLTLNSHEWSQPEVLGDSPEGVSVLDPVLFEYPKGTITAVRSLQTGCKWGEIGGAYIHLNRSRNSGESWDKAVLLEGIPPARTKNTPYVEDALCILPVALEVADGVSVKAYHLGEVIGFRDVAILRSSDTGATWRQTALLQTEDGTCLMEPTTVKLTNGTLLVYMRSAPPAGYRDWPIGKPGRIWQSRSVDGGLSWTKPARTQLPNNNSGFDMCRTRDGRMYLAYNNHCRLGDNTQSLLNNRFPLVLAESRDDGLTWHDIFTIDPGPGIEVSYASIVSDETGRLHCVYTWDRKAVRYVRIENPSLSTSALLEFPECIPV